MTSIISRLASLSAVIISAAACSIHELDIPEPVDTGSHSAVRIEVVPSIQGMDEVQTKSSVTSGESAVKDINIFFYHNGLLVASDYVVTPSVASFTLNEGIEYNVYALANVGKVTPADKESDFIKYRMTVGSAGFVGTMNSGGIPMAWQKSGYTVSRSVTQLPVALVRLVSKIRFKVDMDALAGLKVTSIRLCNGAGAVTPFTMNGHGGSKITAASESISGDYASASDLNTINNGGQIYFYALENCQGTLLSGNKDPWRKTPENISVANLCTYLEVDCEFQAGFALTGTITYRVYLGQDNCTNFDIIRNVDMGVTLCLTKNLDNVSWKIDPDVDYNGSLGDAWIEQGMHSMDDLYVGETVQWGLSINQYLEDFLGQGLEGCRLVARMGDAVNSNLKFGNIIYSGGDYFCDMKCLAATDFPCSLWLVDSDGNYITDFALENDEIDCYEPLLKEGDGSRRRPGESIVAPQSYTAPLVNGSNGMVYLYLTDSHGDNLNAEARYGQYGFDLSLFDRVGMSVSASDAVKAKVSSSAANYIAGTYSLAGVSRGSSMDNGPAFTCQIKSSNSGTNSTLNDALSRVYHMEDHHDGDNHIANLSFSLPNTGSATAKADFGIVKPKFFFGSADTFPSSQGFAYTGMAYIGVYNPSKIDYHVDAFYVGKRRSSTDNTVISGTTQINYLIGGSTPAYLTPRAVRVVAFPYFGDRAYADLKHTATSMVADAVIDGLQCRVYNIDPANGVQTLSEMDGNRGYVRGEVGITTLGGVDLYYDYQDLNGAFVRSDGSVGTSATYNYVWGDDTYGYRGTGWYTGTGMHTPVYANKDGNVASSSGYSGANLYNIMRESPVQFSLTWNATAKCPELRMSGNTFGAKFKVLVGMVFTASCSARNNTTASWSTYTYKMAVPDAFSTTTSYTFSLTGESGMVSLPNYVTVESYFASMNKNYWHEHCTNAINLKSNRFSELAMPVQVDYYVTIMVENDGLWVPISASRTDPSYSVTTSAYTFYSNTARGTYADTSSMTNPDGSSRGSDSSVSSQASRYSDYTRATGSYKVTFNYLHQYNWNWYNR